jgi:PiT family inorganic phosphate transporter
VDLVLFTLVAVVVAALVFDYINGFHDTANAIATVVSTGVLPLRTAIILAASMNLLGAFWGTEVANTIANMVHENEVSQVMVAAGLLGAIAWNLITWWFGIPSSSSHALLGGVLGAAILKAGTGAIEVGNLTKTLMGLFISPIVGFALGFIIMISITWIVRKMRPRTVNRAFRSLQMLSAAGMALAHGKADAQKTMGIIVMSLVSYGALGREAHPPLWVVLSCATAMALGTAAGGVRIIKTMGSKIIDLKPIHGFAAELSSATTIIAAATFGAPLSTTHVISSAIMGVGASQRVSAVRWGVTTKILWAWVLTIPIAGVVGALCYWLLSHLLGR